MAEAAGLALASLGAFNNAIQCFEYIQLAHSYDQDWKTATLKLDVAKLRLCRWASSVGLDKDPPSALGSVREHEKAKDLLGQIVQLFKETERQSTGLKLQKDGKERNIYDPAHDLDDTTSALHQKVERLSLKRFQPRIISKKLKWALFKGKYLNRLIQDITELTDGLIELFPDAQSAQKQLCWAEAAELAADRHASLILPIVKEQDAELKAAIKSQQAVRGGSNFSITFAGSQNSGLQQGYFSGGYQTNNFGGTVLR